MRECEGGCRAGQARAAAEQACHCDCRFRQPFPVIQPSLGAPPSNSAPPFLPPLVTHLLRVGRHGELDGGESGGCSGDSGRLLTAHRLVDRCRLELQLRSLFHSKFVFVLRLHLCPEVAQRYQEEEQCCINGDRQPLRRASLHPGKQKQRCN